MQPLGVANQWLFMEGPVGAVTTVVVFLPQGVIPAIIIVFLSLFSIRLDGGRFVWPVLSGLPWFINIFWVARSG